MLKSFPWHNHHTSHCYRPVVDYLTKCIIVPVVSVYVNIKTQKCKALVTKWYISFHKIILTHFGEEIPNLNILVNRKLRRFEPGDNGVNRSCLQQPGNIIRRYGINRHNDCIYTTRKQCITTWMTISYTNDTSFFILVIVMYCFTFKRVAFSS